MKKVLLNFTLYANMFQLKPTKVSKLKFPTLKNDELYNVLHINHIQFHLKFYNNFKINVLNSNNQFNSTLPYI